MPRYDFECDVPTCKRIFEADAPSSQMPVGPPCVECGGPSTRTWLPSGVHTTVAAVVVYKSPDGSFRFPGATDGASTAKYDAMGYERVEARGWAEVRQLERRMNTHESSQLRRAEERRLEYAERVDSQRRSEIRRGLDQGFCIPEQRMCSDGQIRPTGRMTTVHMRPQGRDAMRRAMDANDRKGHRRIGEPGIHVDAYSNDRSNREDSRDERGRRRHD